jgi:hypothetical protein
MPRPLFGRPYPFAIAWEETAMLGQGRTALCAPAPLFFGRWYKICVTSGEFRRWNPQTALERAVLTQPW